MKQELFKIGKTIAFNAGKYMPKALIGISWGATVGSIILAIQAGMEFQRLKDDGVEITWKDYVRIFGPCAAAGVFSIACAFAGLTESEKRYAAAAALASMYESKEKEIDAKVREIFGDKEADKMHEEIVKNKIVNAPEPPAAFGGTLFLDLLTGQYINMDVETIRACINNANARINNDYDFTVNEWCEMFNEMSNTYNMEFGWNKALTGIITPKFTWHELPRGRTVAALEVNEPELFYKEEREFYENRLSGWSEV